MANNNQNVTIKEIARRAGVSVSTVSRVMSGKKTAIPISESTRKKVLKVCNEMKFLPDVNYTRLQERRSYSIGFLIPRARDNSPHPVFLDDNIGRCLSELELVLAQQGYSILVQGVDSRYEEARTHLRILRNNTVDALIIWDAFRDPAVVAELKEEIRPSICIALPYTESPNSVLPDNFQGAYDMTRYLLGLGHRQVAYINGGMGELTDEQRERGYRKAIEEAGLQPIVAVGNYQLESGIRCAREICTANPGVTAIFAAGDTMAIGVLEYARQAGKRVPQDLSIAGFDGSIASSLTTPPLTTCRLPMQEIGRIAAETVIRMIEEGGSDEPVHQVIPVELLRRESTAAPAK